MAADHDHDATLGIDDPGPPEEDTSIYVDGLAATPAPGPRRRLGLATSGLLVALVAAVGFLAGVRVERAQVGTSTGVNSLASLFASAQGANRGAGPGRAGGGAVAGLLTGTGGGGAAPTVGQVRLVDGTTIYVSDAQGGITKVSTGPRSSFTKTSQGSIADVRPGDTVIVQGQQQSDGTVAATRVVDNGPGQGGASGGSSSAGRTRTGAPSGGAPGD